MGKKNKLIFTLRHKETGEITKVEVKVGLNPISLLRAANKLRKYDKTHVVIDVDSDNIELLTIYRTALGMIEEKMKKRGEGQ